MSGKKKELDMQQLIKALDNDNNQSIVETELDYQKMNAAKNTILQQLQMPREALKKLHTQLKTYRYVETMNELRYGGYIRWISLKNPAELKLTNGGIVVNIKVVQEDDIHIVCRNNHNRLFQIILNENIIFQKLNDQEQVLLAAMDYLNK
jgi:hypothetical protein